MVALGAILALAVSVPAGAAELPPRTGERLNLLSPVSTMPANQPFWVGHGWCTEETDEEPLLLALDPGSRVDFSVDGQAIVSATDVEVGGVSSSGVHCVVEKISYHNFRFGLPAGTHVITGCWYLLDEQQFCLEAAVEFI